MIELRTNSRQGKGEAPRENDEKVPIWGQMKKNLSQNSQKKSSNNRQKWRKPGGHGIEDGTLNLQHKYS